jgi:hypothetical protein
MKWVGPAGVGGGGAESVGISADSAAAPIAAGFNESGAQKGVGCAAVRVRCHANIQFQHGSFTTTLQAPNRLCTKFTAGALGCFLFTSANPEGRFSANKKIHERGIVGREEFVPV